MTQSGAAIARLALLPAAAAYGAAIAMRNWRFDRCSSASHAAGLPVISVGNLAAGGTGKTPLVIEIVRRLRGVGRRAAILTRGYAARHGETPDEVLEFYAALPDTPVIVNRDRVAGAQAALLEARAECVVLDDGFQHRRLRRDLDIVLIDGLNPWAGDALLPAGRLREPPASLRRAQVIIITRCNQLGDMLIAAIERRVARLAPRASCLRSEVYAERLVALDGREWPMADLQRNPFIAVCGIGNPETFARLLAEHAGQRPALLRFRDHQRYAGRELRRIAEFAAGLSAAAVVTTRKDWGKLAPLWKASPPGEKAEALNLPPLLRLDVGARVLDTGGALTAVLQRAVAD